MKTLILSFCLTLSAAAQNLSTLPPAGSVALPLDEYNRLVELAAKPTPHPDTAPVPFALQSAHLNLRVSGDTATGTVDLEGEVLATGATKVPLVAGFAVFEARRQGSPLPLLRESASHVTVLNGPAPFHIALDGGLPVTTESGRAILSIPTPAAGAVRLTLRLPGEHTVVNLSGGVITARSSAGGAAVIEAVLNGGQLAIVSWATRETVAPAAPKEVRFLSDVKSLVTAGEAEITVAALAEVNVVQGDPAEFAIAIPDGWEVTGATGSTLESSDAQNSTLLLKVTPSARAHQFLITMARPAAGGSASFAPLSFAKAQRESGEIILEGEGTMELTAKESGGAKRMDVKEASPFLRSMAHRSVQAAFRYHRQPGENPALALEWTRFPNTALPLAVAQEATVTTLVTSQGRSLTEIKLLLRNREQPFLKVALPAGASIVSADVAGKTVKPVEGADGSRVPLLREGFRPTDAYSVSFVVSGSGSPFTKKGMGELTLPRMDLPIGLLSWEVFLPQQYRVQEFAGDAISASLLPREHERPIVDMQHVPSGMVTGSVVDATGFAIPNAEVTVTHVLTGQVSHSRSDHSGRWAIPNFPAGQIRIEVSALGFTKVVHNMNHLSTHGTQVHAVLQVGSVAETVEVTASGMGNQSRRPRQDDRSTQDARTEPPNQPTAPSANVSDLQRRVSGVLPIAIDVPKEGAAYRFMRPLVLDEETRLTFTYRTGK
jgi:hypothetical protein